MALTEIEYGSLASSEIVNGNFTYLDNKISGVAESITTTAATINSNIATINSTMSSMKEEINNSIEACSDSTVNLLEENGLYVTTYINGESWYREYFADKEKTTRVWCVQGGHVSLGGVNTSCNVTLLKAFEEPLTVLASPAYTNYNSGGGVTYGTAAANFINNSTIRVYVAASNSGGQYWVAYGK